MRTHATSALAAAVWSLLAAGSATAQSRPPLRLTVRVAPIVEIGQGGRIQVTYTVHNERTSRDSLYWFIVDRPVDPAVLSAAPQPDGREVLVLPQFGRHDIGWWAALGAKVPPGDSLSGLGLQATGIAGPVRYWVSRPEVLDSVDTDDPADTQVVDGPISTADRDSGWTVGVVPAPASGGAMAAVLGSQLSFSCRLGWIGNQGICRSLEAKITAGSFQALLNELEAQRGKQVSETAYGMLATNARILLGLPGS